MTDELGKILTDADGASQNKTDSQTVKDGEENTVDDEKKEVKKEDVSLSYYEEELKKAKELIEKQNKSLGIKDRAIESLKKEKNKEEEEKDEETITIKDRVYKKSDVEAIKEIVKNEQGELGKKIDTLVDSLRMSQIDEALSQMTSDADERKLIKLHYQESIQHTGNIKEDLKNARLLANKNFIYNEGLKEGMERKREDVMASFSGIKSTTAKSGESGVDVNDLAIQLAAKVNPEVLKRINK